MAQIVVAVPGAGAGERIDVQAGERVLLGRAPDPSALGETPTEPLREVIVPSPSVSANHATAWLEGDALCIEDVGSRNGTWVRLPRGRAVRIATGEPISVQLAAAPTAEQRDEEPPDPSWTDRSDYAAALVRAVRSWLARIEVTADVTALAARVRLQRDDHPAHIPLADGTVIEVAPRTTVDGRWPVIRETLWRWAERQNRLFATEEETRQEGLILAFPAIRAAHREVIEAAALGVRSVLLIGPSGSGKEGLARAFHRRTGRNDTFVARNCATFSKEMLQAQLFGAEVGAYTGCVRRIVGAVEQAHGGTLFLDEVGELPSELQPMLLRFLDRGEYERMGGDGKTRQADVRVVCATNRDLRAASLKGEFRPDLWYRLSVRVVDAPPLRERPEDSVSYLESCPVEGAGSAWAALSAEARTLVRRHQWDGNFRELMNFAGRLPRACNEGGVDFDACRRALAQGALVLPPMSPAPSAAPAPTMSGIDIARISTEACAAFAEDHDDRALATWNDVSEFVEKYFKPLLFVELSGAATVGSRESAPDRDMAERVHADRGTAKKQLDRFFERFVVDRAS